MAAEGRWTAQITIHRVDQEEAKVPAQELKGAEPSILIAFFPPPPRSRMALQPDASNTMEELGLVAGYASNIILNSTVMMTSAVLHGVYFFLTTSALVILITRKEGVKRARVGLGVTVIILFSISTADLCCRMTSYMLVLERLSGDFNSNLVPAATQGPFDLTKYYTLVLISEALFAISFVIGDAIVIWRAWALSGGRMRIMFLPVVLQVALTGTAFGWIGCFLRAGTPTSVDVPVQCRPSYRATYLLSILTNISGTSVIGYTTWCYRKSIRKYLDTCRHQARAGKIMALLLESGILYTSLLIIQFTFVVAPSNPDSEFAYQAFQKIFSGVPTQLVGLYPVAIIVLVSLQRSLWDTNGVPSPQLSSARTSKASRHMDLESSGHQVLQRSTPSDIRPLSVVLVTGETREVEDQKEDGGSPPRLRS
ncbi:hypothetical protein PM082_000518 [Marasmius tenuissimus]|nr:hypothetical protein PM082_000518 [Marasmius tenuissimus]